MPAQLNIALNRENRTAMLFSWILNSGFWILFFKEFL
jgi:hypothetical protein